MKHEQDIIKWAEDKNLADETNSRNQLIKLFEEAGELCAAELKGDHEKVIDSIGDCLVVLTIYAHSKGLNIDKCITHAWNEIKDRRGKTENGIFKRHLHD